MNTKLLNQVRERRTLVLKAAVLLMGAVVLALCIFALPSIWEGGSVEFPAASTAVQLIVVGLYVTAIPFYIALWQTLKLISYIDRHTAFSDQSVKALRIIRHCANAIGVIYLLGYPLLYPIAEADDAPGLLLFGLIYACLPFVVSVFATVLEKLLQSAIDMKSESELTV
jgi:hypothetical protein